jgi:hypothetical protein
MTLSFPKRIRPKRIRPKRIRPKNIPPKWENELVGKSKWSLGGCFERCYTGLVYNILHTHYGIMLRLRFCSIRHRLEALGGVVVLINVQNAVCAGDF